MHRSWNNDFFKNEWKCDKILVWFSRESRSAFDLTQVQIKLATAY